MLAPWKKSYGQPRQHIRKQRHYFIDKSPSRQSYGFSSSHVWIWEYWTKKLSTKELMLLNWCWRRLLRVPWLARRSNQSILKEIIPDYSLEGLMLKLKFQYFGHLMRRTDSLQKTLMLGNIEDRRRREWQKMRWLDGVTEWMDMNLSKFQVLLMDRKAWHAAVHRVAKSRTWPNEWTDLNIYGCEIWTINKAQCWRIKSFKLWCWRRPENPLDCKAIKPVKA